jgi:hypothetical protein
MRRYQPTVLGETAHDTAGNGALAGAADTGEDDSGVPPPGGTWIATRPTICARFVSAATCCTIGRTIWRSAGSLTGGGWQPAIFSSAPYPALSPRTTNLYDRTGDEITLDEVERIAI